MDEEPKFSRRSLPAVLAALGLSAAGIDSAKAEVEPRALQYLRDRGFDVRTRGATTEIINKDKRRAQISPTPRLSESGLGGIRDFTEFHDLHLKNPEKCRPFLVGKLGALRQILIVPTDGVSEIKRTGPHHGFFYDDTLGLIGILGNPPGGFVYQIDETTGVERKVTDTAALERLRGIEFTGEGSLAKMSSTNCQFIS